MKTWSLDCMTYRGRFARRTYPYSPKAGTRKYAKRLYSRHLRHQPIEGKDEAVIYIPNGDASERYLDSMRLPEGTIAYVNGRAWGK